MKLRPVDFATEGVFLCGLTHAPKSIDECISQASGAAARACTILSKPTIVASGITANVNEELCIGCGTCEYLCSYSAIQVDLEVMKAKVNDLLCKGCGICAATCPKKAVTIPHFTDEQLSAEVRAIAPTAAMEVTEEVV